jgi:hypothetical protein
MDRFWLPLDYSNRNYNFFVIWLWQLIILLQIHYDDQNRN